MKVLALTGYGGNDKLKIVDLAKPAPGAGEVLIRVSHAGLNPLDYKLRQGQLRLIRKLTFPFSMGNEAAGVIDSVGPGVRNFKVGDAVYTRLDKNHMGAFAEFVVESAVNVALAPKSVGADIAAGVPLVALTAYQGLHEIGHLAKGQEVLIHGGAGSVGRFAIQFAKRAGARVTATGSEASRSIAIGLGADHFIDYRKERFDESKTKFDLVFDGVGGETLDRSFKVVKPGGKVVSIAGAPDPQIAREMNAGFVIRTLFAIISKKPRSLAAKAGATYRYFFMHTDGAKLAEFARDIDAGTLKASIDRVFSIRQFAEAFEHQESGKAKGKIVLALDW